MHVVDFQWLNFGERLMRVSRLPYAGFPRVRTLSTLVLVILIGYE